MIDLKRSSTNLKRAILKKSCKDICSFSDQKKRKHKVLTSGRKPLKIECKAQQKRKNPLRYIYMSKVNELMGSLHYSFIYKLICIISLELILYRIGPRQVKQRYSAEQEQTEKAETDPTCQRQSPFTLKANPNHWLFKTKIKEFPNNI